MYHAIAIDLGTTSIKCSGLKADGEFEVLFSREAPPLQFDHLKVRGDAEAYVQLALHLLSEAKLKTTKGCVLSITSQRSSFVVWDRQSGQALSPLISWQDREVKAPMSTHLSQAALQQKTGLIASPYYLANKFRSWLKDHAQINCQSCLVGTMDSWLIWKLSGGDVHITDASMAARTSLYDLKLGDWSQELLQHFEIPKFYLPEVVNSCGLSYQLDQHWTLVAISADQSASLLGQDVEESTVSVTLGTGAFVLSYDAIDFNTPSGYQHALLFRDQNSHYASEGAINGLTRLLEISQIQWSGDSLLKTAYFARPDATGLGAPHWRPELSFYSDCPDFFKQSDAIRRSIVMESVVFRLQEMIEALACEQSQILVAGGRACEPSVLSALASLNERPVFLSGVAESTCRGALRLTGLEMPKLAHQLIRAKKNEAFKEKFYKWKEWLSLQMQYSSLV